MLYMNIPEIQYKTGTATEEEIHAHLMECNDNFHPRLSERVAIDSYSKKLFNKSTTFEAWLDHTLIGLLAIYLNDRINRAGFISSVSLRNDYTGTGIASALMDNCIKYARQQDFKEINLEVHKDNDKAIHLYEKLGFNIIERKDEFLFMKLMLT
jgi:ribosomal protein S18 acetylase RimI-like enzyme